VESPRTSGRAAIVSPQIETQIDANLTRSPTTAIAPAVKYNEVAMLNALCSLYDLARFGDWQQYCRVFICPSGLRPKLTAQP
jgi:hypothetical protein